MHVEAVDSGDRALVVDDLIATGGTLCAAMNLLSKFFSFFNNISLVPKLLLSFKWLPIDSNHLPLQ
jgi:adenine phosphoribosyltransferase